MARRRIVRTHTKNSVRALPPDDGAPQIECPCGKTTLVDRGDTLEVWGPGWQRIYEFIQCGKCGWEHRFSPHVVWAGASGKIYDR